MPRDELLGLLAGRDRELAVLREQNAALEQVIGELRDKLARLERVVSRNSGNSSMPPSADDLPGRTPPQPKKKRTSGKRKPGKQPGAPGAHLCWSEQPDELVDHFPAGACGCGADLADAGDLGVSASHQVIDVPAQTATVTQHNLHDAQCGCGRVHRAAAPPGTGAPGTVTYGLGLQAVCVYLVACHHLPVHRCAELIEALTGARPSPGFVHSMIRRAAAAVAEANKLIRALVILAHVACADETPIRVGPGPKTRKRYLLVACTRLLTYFFLGDRSAKTFAAFVFPDMDGAAIVHDRYQNYDAFPGLVHRALLPALRRHRRYADTGMLALAPRTRRSSRPRCRSRSCRARRASGSGAPYSSTPLAKVARQPPRTSYGRGISDELVHRANAFW